MKRFGRRVLAGTAGLVVLLTGLWTGAPAAVAEEKEPKPEPRTVIALYDGAVDEKHPDVENPIAQVIEMPCNWLGVTVRARCVRDGPPPAKWFDGSRAVITWFERPFALPKWVWPWLQTARTQHGQRVVHFEALPKTGDPDSEQKQLAEWLKDFGLEWKTGHVGGLARVDVEFADEALCRLEADPRRNATHEGPANVSKANRVWVTTRDKEKPEDARSPVVTGPWGGIALSPWHLKLGDGTGSRRWHLDPFHFLRAALDLEGIPAPDPSVSVGRRMFVMHVDGDGFESLSTPGGTEMSARVFMREVLQRYRLPCTASIIVGSLSKTMSPAEANGRMQLAREIFALPYVEVASHGALHPYDWTQEWGPDPKRLANFAYPRIEGFRYSPVEEVTGSIRFIRDHLLPEQKDIVGMLWTGESIPPEGAIRAAIESGCWNLNGGTFRFDDKWNSVGFVSPWARRFGDAIQVYAGAPNENEFDGYFTTHPGAYRHAATTIERTGHPRILKPANVYAHYYSAEQPERLRSIQALIDRFAIEGETVVVPASTYVGAVHGALRMTLSRTESGWRFANAGRCRTLRFDHWTGSVDFSRSEGIIGAREVKGALFVHLNAETGHVAFSDDAPAWPHLLHSNHPLERTATGEYGFTFASYCGHAARSVVIGGFAPGSRVLLKVGEAERTLEVPASGEVRIRLAAGGPDRVWVRSE